MGRLLRGTALGGLVAAAGFGHLGYPLVLGALGRGRSAAAPQDPDTWPGLSVIVPAYKEAGVIAAKVASIRDDDYPGPVEVVVVAEDVATADAARVLPDVVVLQPTDRLGKAGALNVGVAHASHPVLVLTDANNLLVPGALRNLVRRLAPDVGAVAGAKSLESADGEDLYWRFESWLKEREAALGTTFGLVGELYAMRREAWRPIAAGVSADDIWVVCDLFEQGWRVAYAPDATTSEPPAGSLGEEWERRTRIVAGGLVVYWAKRDLIRRGGLEAFEIVGHRLWRYTGGPLAHLALLGVAAGASPRSRLAQLFLAGHVAGALAVVWPRDRRPLPTPLLAAGQVMFLQAVAIGGVVRALRGDRVVVWQKVER